VRHATSLGVEKGGSGQGLLKNQIGQIQNQKFFSKILGFEIFYLVILHSSKILVPSHCALR
jgi:hypothetical protein